MPTLVERARAHRTANRSIVVVLGCVGVVFAITTFAHRYGLADLALDRAAVRSWLGGDGLYAYRSPDSQLGPALPPVAALFLVPAAFLPLGTAGWLIGLAGVAALVLALVALVGPVARRYGRRRWPAVFAATALALTIEPVRAALGLGDLDLLLFGLITADVVALRRGAWARSRAAWWPGRAAAVPPRGRPVTDLARRGWATGAWAGVGTGLATVLAVGPALFIAYFAVTRQWRAALTALGTAGTLAAGALLLAPRETAAWFGEVLWRLDRTGGVDRPGNQSLAGVLARLYDSATTPVLLWFSFALLLVAVGMIRARSAHADGDEIAAFTLVGLTGAIVGPVSDTHELVWVLPALLILVDAAARQRAMSRRPRPGRNDRFLGAGYAAAAALTYLLFVAAPVWTFGDAGGLAGMIGANAYALGVILLVNALPWRPGVAPAFPINRWAKQMRRQPRPVPPARRG
ncbi:MAG TPA: glycosyltransferase 87 family protein [Actinoplanes sp.]|jgi:alpha-1,2-mannosyltransferase|nr:glycosyltransferase 87 family protein [Actinoplanes sp.]